MSSITIPQGMEIVGPIPPQFESILTLKALEFVAGLHHEFDSRRRELLTRRDQIQAQIDSGRFPDFLPETEWVRTGDWRVTDIPDDLQDRRVEITGPVERKMMINALNSGANVFMADFEDASSPTWSNVITGQINLVDAVDRTISLTTADGKEYRLDDRIATLVVRPRGWHLDERHVRIDGRPISGSLFDFGLYLFHNAKKLIVNGTGPYFYLPKLENHLEARLWNDVFGYAQDRLGLRRGTIKVTVLIETILAAFEMEEILYDLRDHITALNAGRWDYIFSAIKKFRNCATCFFPDRSQVTMTVPFMRAYTELMVKTCHRRGAHAMGGMAAYIPSRRDPAANELALAKVREDKEREARDGFDGTWVAHPDLVPIAKEVFDYHLGPKKNQTDRQRDDVRVTAEDLTNFKVEGGTITADGVRNNISVGVWYLESWLRGIGAAAIYNLMEDTATAEISRSQLWQWVHNENGRLADGTPVSVDLIHAWLPQELEKVRQTIGDEAYQSGKFELAARLFERLVTDREFTEFLTWMAYEHLD